jgi:hypothetical protein
MLPAHQLEDELATPVPRYRHPHATNNGACSRASRHLSRNTSNDCLYTTLLQDTVLHARNIAAHRTARGICCLLIKRAHVLRTCRRSMRT